MSIEVTFKDGIVEPSEAVHPGQNCTAFSDDELHGIFEILGSSKPQKKTTSSATASRRQFCRASTENAIYQRQASDAA